MSCGKTIGAGSCLPWPGGAALLASIADVAAGDDGTSHYVAARAAWVISGRPG